MANQNNQIVHEHNWKEAYRRYRSGIIEATIYHCQNPDCDVFDKNGNQGYKEESGEPHKDKSWYHVLPGFQK